MKIYSFFMKQDSPSGVNSWVEDFSRHLGSEIFDYFRYMNENKEKDIILEENSVIIFHTVPGPKILDAIIDRNPTVTLSIITHAMPEHLICLSCSDTKIKRDTGLAILNCIRKCDIIFTRQKRYIQYWKNICKPGAKIEYIPMGVDSEHWKPVESVQKLEGKPSILIADTWNQLKQPIVPLFAMPQVLRQFPDAVLYITVPSDNEGRRILDIARVIGISDNVRYLKYDSGMVERYSSVDITVTCNIFKDTSSIYYESEMCGTPCIVIPEDYSNQSDFLANKIVETSNKILENNEKFKFGIREQSKSNLNISETTDSVKVILYKDGLNIDGYTLSEIGINYLLINIGTPEDSKFITKKRFLSIILDDTIIDKKQAIFDELINVTNTQIVPGINHIKQKPETHKKRVNLFYDFRVSRTNEIKPLIMLAKREYYRDPLALDFFSSLSKSDILDIHILEDETDIDMFIRNEMCGNIPDYIYKGFGLFRNYIPLIKFANEYNIPIIAEIEDIENLTKMGGTPSGEYFRFLTNNAKILFFISRLQPGYPDNIKIKKYVDNTINKGVEIVHIPWSIIPDKYDLDIERDIDVAFTMTVAKGWEYHKNRVNILNKLIGSKYDIIDNMTEYDKKQINISTGGLKIFVGNVYGEEYIRMLNRSKIFIVECSMRGGATQKYVEGPACGCMLLGEIPICTNDIYEDGVSIVKADISNIIHKICFYSKNNRKRERIALEGKRRILEHRNMDIAVNTFIEKICGKV